MRTQDSQEEVIFKDFIYFLLLLINFILVYKDVIKNRTKTIDECLDKYLN